MNNNHDPNITFASYYGDYPINTDETKNEGCYLNMLQRLSNVFESGIDRDKTLFTHLTFNFPENTFIENPEAIFSVFVSYYVKTLNRMNYNVFYFWRREQKLDKRNCHYHLFLCLNGNKCQSYYTPFKIAKTQWSQRLGILGSGYVDHSDNAPDIMIRRRDEDYREQVNNAFRWASYGCKAGENQEIPAKHMFGSSLIPQRKGSNHED